MKKLPAVKCFIMKDGEKRPIDALQDSERADIAKALNKSALLCAGYKEKRE